MQFHYSEGWKVGGHIIFCPPAQQVGVMSLCSPVSCTPAGYMQFWNWTSLYVAVVRPPDVVIGALGFTAILSSI